MCVDGFVGQIFATNNLDDEKVWNLPAQLYMLAAFHATGSLASRSFVRGTHTSEEEVRAPLLPVIISPFIIENSHAFEINESGCWRPGLNVT